MIEFVFMLTHHDQTVARPLEVLEQVRDCGLRYVGWLLGGTHAGDGLALLAYRHPTADAAQLTSTVVQAATGPVIAAGSVASTDQIHVLADAGAWGLTIGGATFEGRPPSGPSVPGQVEAVLAAAAGHVSQDTSA